MDRISDKGRCLAEKMSEVCLLLWIVMLVLYLVDLKNNREPSPGTAIGAMLVCIAFYLQEVFG